VGRAAPEGRPEAESGPILVVNLTGDYGIQLDEEEWEVERTEMRRRWLGHGINREGMLAGYRWVAAFEPSTNEYHARRARHVDLLIEEIELLIWLGHDQVEVEPWHIFGQPPPDSATTPVALNPCVESRPLEKPVAGNDAEPADLGWTVEGEVRPLDDADPTRDERAAAQWAALRELLLESCAR
jgi:hypothetical protein